MIIYATQPSRIYPYISEELKKTQEHDSNVAGRTVLFIEKLSNNEWYEVPTVTEKGNCEYYSHLQKAHLNKRPMPFINGRPRLIFDNKFREKYNIVTGVMNTNDILKEEGDFLFCTAIHPIDHLYEMYHFMQYMASGISLNNEVTNQNLAHWGEFFNFAAPAADFRTKSKNNVVSLERYIDLYIELKGTFKVPNTNIELCENLFNQTFQYNKNIDHISFVTDIKSILRSCSILNKKLGTNLQFQRLYAFTQHIRKLVDSNLYRKKELESILAEKIYHFEALKKEHTN